MTTRTIDCAECGASVPYGRLSCPSCGSLLASVTGGRPLVVPEAAVASEPVQPLLLPDDDEPPDGPFAPLEAPAPVLAGRPYPGALDDEGQFGTMASRPNAARPSTLSLSGAVAAAGWAAPSPASPAAAAPGHATATVQTRIGTIDPARFAEIAGWFVIVGATMAVLGFLLPWSSVVIGAAGRGGSYLDTWGIASPTHVVVLAMTMIVLALGIVRTPVPVWVRSGVLPLALGSLLIGLVWPYQVGPLGADVGILVVALGGLAMAMGGVVGSWATRHVEADPAV